MEWGVPHQSFLPASSASNCNSKPVQLSIDQRLIVSEPDLAAPRCRRAMRPGDKRARSGGIRGVVLTTRGETVWVRMSLYATPMVSLLAPPSGVLIPKENAAERVDRAGPGLIWPNGSSISGPVRRGSSR